MATSMDDARRLTALQGSLNTANQPSQTDANVQMIYQSLLSDDPEVKRLIKGEVQEPLDNWRKVMQELRNTLDDKQATGAIVTQAQADHLIALLKEGNEYITKLELQMKKYRYYLPHLLMLSPLMRLGIITQKQADAVKLRQKLMISRDRLRASYEGSDLLDENWFDAVLIAENMAVQESVDGLKLYAVTRDVKQVTTVIDDRTKSAKNRSFWRPFG